MGLTIDGTTLEAEYITSTGYVADRFSIVKGEIVAVTPAGPDPFTRVHPNPFASSTTIAFAMARPGAYAIEVYDLAGRRVRELSGSAPSGPVVVSFDGRDSAGIPLASGTYLYRVRAEGAEYSGRMSLVR